MSDSDRPVDGPAVTEDTVDKQDTGEEDSGCVSASNMLNNFLPDAHRGW